MFASLSLLLALCPAQGTSLPERAGPIRPPKRDSSQYARSIVDEARGGVVRTADGDMVSAEPPPELEIQLLLGNGVGAPVGTTPTNGSPAGTPTPRVYEVTIDPVTTTGAKERFLFQEVGLTGPRPLLVVFHKFGLNHYDTLLHTSYFEEARRRGWYCAAPFGGMQSHFGNEKSQLHTDAVLEWATGQFAIDPQRIYAVGFSMGGGAALSYAARNLDPNRPMIAAVYAISPIASITDTYVVDPQIQPHFDQANMFGNGTPGSAGAAPFSMQRSSLISFNGGGVVDPTTDLASNLLHIRTRCAIASGDIPYLLNQNTILRDHFVALGAPPSHHPLDLYTTPPMYHSWDLVAEKVACDWLGSKRLQLPTSGSTLADAEARYFWFDVLQDASPGFTPFDWEVDALANSVEIVATRNLERITFDPLPAGLATGAAMTVTTQAADGSADEVSVRSWSIAPSAVLRDGVATSSWTYHAPTATVTLQETDPAAHAWTIVP